MIKSNQKFYIQLQKVLVISSAFFLFLNHSFAGLKPVVKQTEVLTLEKQRQKAIELVVNYIKNENPSKAQKKIAIAKLNRISEMFYTEKALKKYSLAESILYTDVDLAILTLEAVLDLEPYNAKANKALTLTYLLKDQCSKAEKKAMQSLQANPYQDDLRLLYLNILLCNNDLDKFTSELVYATHLKDDINFKHFMAVYSLKIEDYQKIKYYLKQLNNTNLPIVTALKHYGEPKSVQLNELKDYVETCSIKKVHEKYKGKFFYCDYLNKIKKAYDEKKNENEKL